NPDPCPHRISIVWKSSPRPHLRNFASFTGSVVPLPFTASPSEVEYFFSARRRKRRIPVHDRTKRSSPSVGARRAEAAFPPRASFPTLGGTQPPPSRPRPHCTNTSSNRESKA